MPYTTNFAWDNPPDADLANIRMHVGAQSGVYGLPTKLMGLTQAGDYTVQEPGTYFAALKAVDAEGLDSPVFSNEVVFIAGLQMPVCSFLGG